MTHTSAQPRAPLALMLTSPLLGRPARPTCSALIMLCLPLMLSACGEDEVATTQQRGIPAHMLKSRGQQQSSSGGGAAQGAKAKAGGFDISIPNRLKRKELLSASGWRSNADIRAQVESMRDPFWPDIPELKDPEEIEVDPTSIQQRLVVTVPVPVQTLEFKGSLTGLEVNLAMLEDSGGTGYTVRVGDIIGRNPEFVRVHQITSSEIRFKPILGISEDEPIDSPKLLKTLKDNDDSTSFGGAL